MAKIDLASLRRTNPGNLVSCSWPRGAMDGSRGARAGKTFASLRARRDPSADRSPDAGLTTDFADVFHFSGRRAAAWFGKSPNGTTVASQGCEPLDSRAKQKLALERAQEIIQSPYALDAGGVAGCSRWLSEARATPPDPGAQRHTAPRQAVPAPPSRNAPVPMNLPSSRVFIASDTWASERVQGVHESLPSPPAAGEMTG